MVQINDPDGKAVGVSLTGNRLDVSARADSRIYYVSRDDGQAYSITSIDSPSAADEYNLFFKNTSSNKNFVVSEFLVSSAVLTIFKISTVTDATPATGTAITPVNLNATSANEADATVLGNAAVVNLVEKNLLFTLNINADDQVHFDTHDSIILGKNDAIAIEYDVGAGSDTIHLTMFGYYDPE